MKMLPECDMMFKIIENKLDEIKTNDLVHIDKKIDTLNGWVKWVLGILVSIGLGVGVAVISKLFG